MVFELKIWDNPMIAEELEHCITYININNFPIKVIKDFSKSTWPRCSILTQAENHNSNFIN